jgi:hypothetical protein
MLAAKSVREPTWTSSVILINEWSLCPTGHPQDPDSDPDLGHPPRFYATGISSSCERPPSSQVAEPGMPSPANAAHLTCVLQCVRELS